MFSSPETVLHHLVSLLQTAFSLLNLLTVFQILILIWITLSWHNTNKFWLLPNLILLNQNLLCIKHVKHVSTQIHKHVEHMGVQGVQRCPKNKFKLIMLFRDNAWTITHINITQPTSPSKEEYLILSAGAIGRIQNAKC